MGRQLKVQELHNPVWYKPRCQSSYIGGPKSLCVCGPSYIARTATFDLPANLQHAGGFNRIKLASYRDWRSTLRNWRLC